MPAPQEADPVAPGIQQLASGGDYWTSAGPEADYQQALRLSSLPLAILNTPDIPIPSAPLAEPGWDEVHASINGVVWGGGGDDHNGPDLQLAVLNEHYRITLPAMRAAVAVTDDLRRTKERQETEHAAFIEEQAEELAQIQIDIDTEAAAEETARLRNVAK